MLKIKQILTITLVYIVIGLVQGIEKRQSIAIIGGGIGSAFLQSYLREQNNNSVDLVIYEKQNKLGGRCRSFSYEGKTYELGKQRFTNFDQFMMNFTESAGVTTSRNQITISTYNQYGIEFDLRGFFFLRPINFLFNYPISSPFYFLEYQKNWDRINQIYNLVEEKKYKNFRDILTEGKMDDLIDYSFEEYMKSSYFIGSSFIQSFLRALNVYVFDQTETINALAGYSSQFIGAGQTYKVDQGLEQMVNNLINQKSEKKNKVSLNLNTNITSIEYLQSQSKNSSKYRLHFNNTYRDFDQVVIAFSLEQLQDPQSFFKNFTEQTGAFIQNLKTSSYSTHVVTFVRAPNLLQSYLGFNDTRQFNDLMVPQDQNSKQDFYKILRVCEKCYKDRSNLYELTSSKKITKQTVTKIFGESAQIVEQKEWDALYPEIKKFDAKEILDYQLSNGLYYLHAAEQAIPLLSFEAISAKVVANLMNPEFKTKDHKEVVDDL